MHKISHGALCFMAGAAILAIAAGAQAQTTARVAGKIVDPEGKPLKDVKITVTSPEMPSLNIEKKSNKKGEFVVSHIDATLVYQYRLVKEGFQSQVVPIRPQLGAVTERTFILQPGSDEAAVAPQPTGRARAIAVYNEGVEAQVQGNSELAAKRFGEAIKEDPELGAAHTALGSLAHLAGDYAAAAQHAERALEIDPTDLRALELRYDAYRLLGDEAKAKAAAEALRTAGDTSNAARRVYNEAADAFNAGDLATAKSKLEETVALDPSLVPAQAALASIYLREGNAQAASAAAAKVLESEPSNVSALKIRYDTARHLGDTDTARATLHALVAADPEWASTGLYQHALDLFNDGKMTEATTALEQLLAVEPDHPRAHYTLGLCLFNTGNTEAAKQHLSRFLELAPDDPDAAVAQEMLNY